MNVSGRQIATLLGCIMLLGFGTAVLAIDGVTVGGGGWEDSSRKVGYRVSTRWNWSKAWRFGEQLTLTGYWEPSISYWRNTNGSKRNHNEVLIAAFSPVFKVLLDKASTHHFKPYFEFGIGISLMSEDEFADRDLGSFYHFEDRLGLGAQIGSSGRFDISYRYFHYSNASIIPPNDGLDFHTLNFTWLL